MPIRALIYTSLNCWNIYYFCITGVFRFDASDLMPGAIGAGAFWSEMTAFANGQDAQTTADNIQAAWDAIK